MRLPAHAFSRLRDIQLPGRRDYSGGQEIFAICVFDGIPGQKLIRPMLLF